ncbi:MAG: phytanoyl-CoA dioxygenase family protein [Armatimonadetes bacterium]|nr:phytanoyl-CoA dioxygenase family protein [Armatimonadota bacterium]
MQLTEEQVQAYWANGYVVVPPLFSEAECAEIDAALDDVLAEVRQEGRAAGQSDDQILNHGVYVGLSVRRKFFRRVARDPRLVDPLEAIWNGPDIGFLSDKVIFKGEEVEFGSPWHQDWAYWKGSHKLTVWVAIGPVTPENGCLMVVPGSHRRPLEHQSFNDPKTGFGNRIDLAAHGLAGREVTVPLESGAAVFFHDLTVHASHPCAAGRRRRALAVTYRNLAEPDLDYPGLPAAARVRGAEPALA